MKERDIENREPLKRGEQTAVSQLPRRRSPWQTHGRKTTMGQNGDGKNSEKMTA